MSDETKKSRYDNGQDLEGGGGCGHRGGGMGDVDPNLIFQQFFGGGMGGGMGGGRGGHSHGGMGGAPGGFSFSFG